MNKIVIIGAGIGGIATAALLGKKGYDVTVIEQHASPGGRAGLLETDGFTFDTGPSWYLMPEVFGDFFRIFDEDISEHLTLKRLDPAYKVFFEGDKPAITIHAELDTDTQTFESIEAGAADKLRNYVKEAEDIYQLAMKHFLYTDFDSPHRLIQRDIVRSAPRLLRSLFEPLDKKVSRLFHDQRLKQILEYPMVFLGSSPYEAPSLYSLMSYLDFKQGVYYPEGGLYTVIEALEKIALKHEVKFIYGATVKSITNDEKIVTGVLLTSGDHLAADAVISSADLHATETKLVSRAYRTYPETYWDKKQAGPSAILMYLGIRDSLPTLEHHNLLFVDDWRPNFTSIFDEKDWPIPASIYLCNPSKSDASVAPADHENVFVLVPGPAKVDDTDAAIEALAEKYLDQISVMTGIPDLKSRIVTKKIVGPRHFENQFAAWRGTALGMSHVLSQSAMFRPQNKSKKLQNLYYVGANTVPGIGLPMCLISAQLVASRLSKDWSR